MNREHYGDNFIPVIPVDRRVHTPDHPICSDADCPCHEPLKQELQQYYQNGLLTMDDATRILEGRQLWQ